MSPTKDMSSGDCSIDLRLPQAATYVYGVIYIILLLIVGIQSFHTVLNRIIGTVSSNQHTSITIANQKHNDQDKYHQGTETEHKEKDDGNDADEQQYSEQLSPGNDDELKNSQEYSMTLFPGRDHAMIQLLKQKQLREQQLQSQIVMLQQQVLMLQQYVQLLTVKEIEPRNKISDMDSGQLQPDYDDNDNDNYNGINTYYIPPTQKKKQQLRQTDDGYWTRDSNSNVNINDKGQTKNITGKAESEKWIGKSEIMINIGENSKYTNGIVTQIARNNGNVVTNRDDIKCTQTDSDSVSSTHSELHNYNYNRAGRTMLPLPEKTRDTVHDSNNYNVDVSDSMNSDSINSGKMNTLDLVDGEMENSKFRVQGRSTQVSMPSSVSTSMVVSCNYEKDGEKDGEIVCSICFESVTEVDKEQNNALLFDCSKHRCIHKDCGMMIELMVQDDDCNNDHDDDGKDDKLSSMCPICKEIAFIPPASSLALKLLQQRARTITTIKKHKKSRSRKIQNKNVNNYGTKPITNSSVQPIKSQVLSTGNCSNDKIFVEEKKMDKLEISVDRDRHRIQRSQSFDQDLMLPSNYKKVRFAEESNDKMHDTQIPHPLPITKEGKSFKENLFDAEGPNGAKSIPPGVISIRQFGTSSSSSSSSDANIDDHIESVVFVKSQVQPDSNLKISEINDMIELNNTSIHVKKANAISTKAIENQSSTVAMPQAPHSAVNDQINHMNNNGTINNINIQAIAQEVELEKSTVDIDSNNVLLDENDVTEEVKVGTKTTTMDHKSDNDIMIKCENDSVDEKKSDQIEISINNDVNNASDASDVSDVSNEGHIDAMTIQSEIQVLMIDNNAVSYSNQNNQINSLVREMHDNLTQDDKNNFYCNKKVLKFWLRDVWNKRKCYLPLLTHLIDQMTDIGVLIELYMLYLKEKRYGADLCSTINPLFLFVASMIAFLFYRIVSAIVIFKQTKDLKRFFYQLFDLELYRALYLNYKLNAPNPTNPQRWIQSLGMSTFIWFVYAGMYEEIYIVFLNCFTFINTNYI